MFHIALFGIRDHFVKGLGAFNARAADLFSFALGVLFKGNLSEERGQMIILVLRPAFEGVVMALVAIKSSGKEEVRRILHRFGRGAQDFPIIGGRILAARARSGQDFPRELIVGRVLLQFLADPVPEQFRPFRAQKLAVALQQVRPLVRPEINVLRAADQAVHHGIPFGAGFACVIHECANLVGRRRQAGEIQVNAANKIQVGAKLGRLNFHPLPFGRDEFIDFAPRGRFLPDEAAAIAHLGKRGGSIIALVTRQHGRFAAAQSREQARGIDSRHIGISALNKGFRGNVPDQSICIGGHDTHLLLRTNLLHHRVLRGNFDPGDARRFHVEVGAVGDPLPQDLVILAVHGHAAAPFVRHFGHCFQKHQAVIGRSEVDPA